MRHLLLAGLGLLGIAAKQWLSVGTFCGDRKWRARGMGSRVDRTDHVRRPGKAALWKPLSRRKREALRLAGSFTDALFFRGRRVGRAAVPHVAERICGFLRLRQTPRQPPAVDLLRQTAPGEGL